MPTPAPLLCQEVSRKSGKHPKLIYFKKKIDNGIFRECVFCSLGRETSLSQQHMAGLEVVPWVGGEYDALTAMHRLCQREAGAAGMESAGGREQEPSSMC